MAGVFQITQGLQEAQNDDPDQRELYISPNGDQWLLCRDRDTDRVFVRHQPNAPSGGQVSDLDIGTFLRRVPLNPEHLALLRLIATLVLGGA
jgi:hypothetical protein